MQGHREYVIKTLLHGMTGPLEGRTYPAGVMMPLGTNSDAWIADIASYVRNSFGNRSSFVMAADVARVRAATSSRNTMWTFEELEASQPRLLVADSTWKVTASHNPSAAPGALTYTTWRSDGPQAAGMWFQVELPGAVTLAEIQFESPGQGGRGGGGGRGRGGAVPGGEGAAVPAAPPVPAAPTPASPRRYTVEVSSDGATWSAPIAEGAGTGQSTVIAFAPVRAKFVRITQTATVAL